MRKLGLSLITALVTAIVLSGCVAAEATDSRGWNDARRQSFADALYDEYIDKYDITRGEAACIAAEVSEAFSYEKVMSDDEPTQAELAVSSAAIERCI